MKINPLKESESVALLTRYLSIILASQELKTPEPPAFSFCLHSGVKRELSGYICRHSIFRKKYKQDSIQEHEHNQYARLDSI